MNINKWIDKVKIRRLHKVIAMIPSEEKTKIYNKLYALNKIVKRNKEE